MVLGLFILKILLLKFLKKLNTNEVGKFSDLIYIRQHFDKYSLKGLKSFHDYLIWKEIVSLIETKAHLTLDGLTKIKLLITKLNK